MHGHHSSHQHKDSNTSDYKVFQPYYSKLAYVLSMYILSVLVVPPTHGMTQQFVVPGK